MKQIIVLWALVTVVLSDADKEIDKDNWYSTEDGKLYYIETESKFNWFQAVHECTRKNMSLISEDSLDKYQNVLKLITGIYQYTGHQSMLWIGGHDNAVSRHFEWVATGQAIGSSHWTYGEPDNDGGNEHCVAIWSDGYGWTDEPCSSEFGFICEENQVLKRTNQVWMEARAELDDLEADIATVKPRQQVLNELKKSYETQAKHLQQKQEELDTFKKSSVVQANLLKRTQEELDLLKKTKKEEKYQHLNGENEKYEDAYVTITDIPEQDKQSFSPNAELDTLKQPCQANKLSLKLEALKTSNEILANRLKQRTEELQALQKSRGMLTGQEITGQTEILDGLQIARGSQTNGTVSNRYYKFVVNVNETQK